MFSILNQVGGKVAFELPARFKSIDQLQDNLRNSTEKVAGKIAGAKRTAGKHDLAAHIIGIERWAQRRLKVALGEAFNDEEYDGYRPADDTDWDALKAQFEATRLETLNLADALKDTNRDRVIEHNQWGELTVRGWLQYINAHANLTALLL
jgi:hypothetical protein